MFQSVFHELSLQKYNTISPKRIIKGFQGNGQSHLLCGYEAERPGIQEIKKEEIPGRESWIDRNISIIKVMQGFPLIGKKEKRKAGK
ncbi:MAG: hypothetical protein ACOC0U_06300 [Desulfovibrionales bacterium]